MRSEREQLEAVIEGLESQRGLLGDAFVDAGLAPLRARLAALVEAQASPTPTQTLKQVTILFLDVVGSTLLSQHLDPEEIHAVMDGAPGALHRHRRGAITARCCSTPATTCWPCSAPMKPAKTMPSGLSAAASPCWRKAARSAPKCKRQHGHEGFDVRVGVHTGGVLLGGGVDAEGSIRGIAVNIAARMEQTAPRRHAAHQPRHLPPRARRVRGRGAGPHRGQGRRRARSPPTWCDVPSRARFALPARGIEGVETRMIGRDAELETLQRAFQRLFVERRPALVTVVAEAGIGKSRLLYEFEDWSRGPARGVLRLPGPRQRRRPRASPTACCATSSPGGCRSPTATASTPPSKRSSGHRAAVRADDGADMAQAHAHLLGHLIGWTSATAATSGASATTPGRSATAPSMRRRRCFAASRPATRRRRPIVLLLEDLHWADDGSLDFLKLPRRQSTATCRC